ncbi:hypothetical protein CBS101457_006428 [Exobasidium rhododendri]|nr:hypothetical protein CBS101457_006428 [Exobasidium rhododendri]
MSDLDAHPALSQFGLFAAKDIPPHTLVVPYFGHVHLISEEDPDSRYDAAIESDDGTRLGIDATRAGSEARFVNDFRGILIRPNVFLQDWSARSPHEKDNQDGIMYPKRVKGIAFFSGAHSIKAGTELCTTYGKGWWNSRRDQSDNGEEQRTEKAA